MKTKYQYISFKLLEHKPKTSVWECVNNRGDYPIGIIKWYPQWRQYCFYPNVATVYSSGCLSDIIDFIKQATEDKQHWVYGKPHLGRGLKFF